MNNRPNWFEANPKKAKLLVFLLCFLLVEGLVRLCVYAGLLPYREYPTAVGTPRFWAYIDPVVGMWRYPNTTFRHTERCIDAEYHTNSIGARDKERAPESGAERRVVVLGDSFVEGYGFKEEGRATNLLEARTGVEFMNFGTSGGFGTIQEWLLYTSKVQPYQHTDVVLFIFPGNDFSDNDPGHLPASVYKPYLRRTSTGFEVYYTVPWEKRFTDDRKRSTVIKNTIDNNLYIANVLRWATSEVKERTKEQRKRFQKVAYDQDDPEDLEIMLYALNQIVAAAGDRRVWLLTVPAENDFSAARRRGYRFPLGDALAKFAGQHATVHYMDLLPVFLRDAAARGLDFDAYGLPCDHHWGERGNALVADVLQAWMFDKSAPDLPATARGER